MILFNLPVVVKPNNEDNTASLTSISSRSPEHAEGT